MGVPEPRVVAELIVRTIGVLEQTDHAERADVRHRVREEIEEDGASAVVVRRQERDEQVAAVADARVRENALHVSLRHAHHRPDDHRRRREQPDHVAPRAAERIERREEHAHERRERGRLDAGRHEPGHGGRRAFVCVGRPHVERHRRDLEREADDHQADREQLHRRRRSGLRGHEAGDAIEPCAARQPVGERNAVQEKRAGERAEQEVLERRFRRRRRVAADACQHVHRERQHLEREKDDEEIRRRRHQHHAGRGEEHQCVVLARRQPLAIDGWARNRQRQHADGNQDPGHENAEVVGEHETEARQALVPQIQRCERAAYTL